MFKFTLLLILLLLIFPETNCLIAWFWPLRDNKFKVIASLSPKYGLVTSLSPKRHGLLMHFKFDDLFLVENILDLNLAHLCEGHVPIAIKVLPVDATTWLSLIAATLVWNYDVLVLEHIWVRLSFIVDKDTRPPDGELVLACMQGQSVGWVPVA